MSQASVDSARPLPRKRVALIMPAPTAVWGGVQRFAASLHGGLAELCDVEQFCFHPGIDVPRTLRAWMGSAIPALGRLRSVHANRPFDAVLSTFHGPPRLLRGVQTMGFVHDLRLWDLHDASKLASRRRSLRALGLRATFGSWDIAFVPSAHVAGDVARLVPSLQVENVGEGLDHLDMYDDGERRQPRDVILLVAGRAPHKRASLGMRVLEEAVEALGCAGVVVGRPDHAPRSARIEVQSPDDAGLVRLYRRARVALVPTEYEGFGLAAGEAMRFGAPVVFARDCPLEDLVGNGGMGAAPDVESLLAAVRHVWERSSELGPVAQSIAAAYTWRRTAERIHRHITRA